jgi:P-type conjugative transfer protein TrbJ
MSICNLKVKHIAFATLLALGLNGAAQAQWVVTNPISDIATQAQHAARYAQAADAYAKQLLQLQNQILQYEAMLKNLQDNPLGAVVPNLGLLARNTAKIMANGEGIANNMGNVSDNIARAFKNPQGDFGVKFRIWSNASKEALTGAMLNAGLQREQFADDTQALEALVTKNAASQGALAATKTLGEIASAQLAESYKLRDLISAQQLATNNFMMAETSKKQEEVDAAQAFLRQGNGQVRRPGQSNHTAF